MALQRIVSPDVPEAAPGLWSNAMRAGDFLYISGQVFRNAAGVYEGADAYAQSMVIFGKIKRLVEAAGGTMKDIVKVTIFVVDITKNTEVWRARQQFFTGDFPCSSLVQVAALAKPETLVEIEAVAYLGGARA